MFKFIEEFLKKNLLNGLFLFFFSFFFLVSFIRMDAELLIFLSIFLVVFSVWNFLSNFLSKVLFIKMTLYYYYFVRYYQGRIWLVFLISRYASIYLFSKRLPYFIKWYKLYEGRFNILCNVNFNNLVEGWENLLNLYIYNLYLIVLANIWVGFYKSYANLYLRYAVDNIDSFDNSRKLTEYILLNKVNLEF